MARYFFGSHDSETLLEDEAGVECAGVEAARIKAQNALADMVRDALPNGSQRTITVLVRDETGRTVVKAAASILVEVEPWATGRGPQGKGPGSFGARTFGRRGSL